MLLHFIKVILPLLVCCVLPRMTSYAEAEDTTRFGLKPRCSLKVLPYLSNKTKKDQLRELDDTWHLYMLVILCIIKCFLFIHTNKFLHHRKKVKMVSCKKESIAQKRNKTRTRYMEQVVLSVDNDVHIVHYHDQTQCFKVNQQWHCNFKFHFLHLILSRKIGTKFCLDIETYFIWKQSWLRPIQFSLARPHTALHIDWRRKTSSKKKKY